MARLIWTAEMDETVSRMEADGASDAEICELKRINRVLEESVDGFRLKVGELMALITKKDRVIGKMAEQIYGEAAEQEQMRV